MEKELNNKKEFNIQNIYYSKQKMKNLIKFLFILFNINFKMEKI